jgi:hypothetical protein
MPIELTEAQLYVLSAVANEFGGVVRVHQVVTDPDIFVAPQGGQNRYAVSPMGEISAVGDPNSAPLEDV